MEEEINPKKDTGYKAKVRECEHNFLKWGEYMKRTQIAEAKILELESQLQTLTDSYNLLLEECERNSL
jgi:hypothetical protein